MELLIQYNNLKNQIILCWWLGLFPFKTLSWIILGCKGCRYFLEWRMSLSFSLQVIRNSSRFRTTLDSTYGLAPQITMFGQVILCGGSLLIQLGRHFGIPSPRILCIIFSAFQDMFHDTPYYDLLRKQRKNLLVKDSIQEKTVMETQQKKYP